MYNSLIGKTNNIILTGDIINSGSSPDYASNSCCETTLFFHKVGKHNVFLYKTIIRCETSDCFFVYSYKLI